MLRWLQRRSEARRNILRLANELRLATIRIERQHRNPVSKQVAWTDKTLIYLKHDMAHVESELQQLQESTSEYFFGETRERFISQIEHTRTEAMFWASRTPDELAESVEESVRQLNMVVRNTRAIAGELYVNAL